MASREEHVYLAKLCEQAERYDEMVQEMDHVAKAVRFPAPRLGWDGAVCAWRLGAPVGSSPGSGAAPA